MEQRIDRLEEKISHLENHVETQDKVVFQLSKQLDSLIALARKLDSSVRELREGSSEASGNFDPLDERPPHY